MLSYYFKNKEGSLSKIVDEDEAYEDINDILIELTEKYKTTAMALITSKDVVQGGKQ